MSKYLTLVLIATTQMWPSIASGQSSNLPIHAIGAGDLLNVYIYDAPELTRTVRVTSDGIIHLPMIPPVKTVGLFPSELESSIGNALRSGEVMVDPIISVTIVEYQSRPITVAGAVKTPITFQAYGHVTLLEALARAGGVAEHAGPDIFVTRSRDGDAPRKISIRDLMSEASQDNLQLSGGEEIRVPEAEKLYVVGNVRRPGAFLVQDRSSPSVLKMLALSEGLLPYPQSMAYIYRDDPEDHSKKEFPIELSKIMKREAPDVSLMPNDVLYIPENSALRGWSTAMQRVLTVTGSGIGTALIYK